MTGAADRSMERIELADLRRLADIAADVEADLFARHPAGSGRYSGPLLCRALCQGAGLHYVDHKAGVKDFDVRSFYAEHPGGPFPARWRGNADFGTSKFGRYSGDQHRYRGRRIDLIGKVTPRPAHGRPGRRPEELPVLSANSVSQSLGGQGRRAHNSLTSCRRARLAPPAADDTATRPLTAITLR